MVSHLGETKAALLRAIVEAGERTAPELAERLDVSAVAVRKHLAALEEDGLIAARQAQPNGRGRPAQRYSLTDEGRRLLPNRTAEVAHEALDFLSEHGGPTAVLAFHRWRREREKEALDGVVTAEDLHERLGQLADALAENGYEASVGEDGETLTLTQTHCAIYDVAKDHPELCAHEAAMFRKVLGADVSRRQTLAGGDTACVCTVTPKGAPRQATPDTTTDPRSPADDAGTGA